MSSSAGGTHVVLPVPGGAHNTTSRFAVSESRNAGMMDSTGNTKESVSDSYAASQLRIAF